MAACEQLSVMKITFFSFQILKKNIFRILFFPVLALCFSACVTPLYYWGNYEDEVYKFLQNGSPESQIAAMERDREKIESGSSSGKKGMNAPPGFYAHLGMLYSEAGDDEQAISCFITEKTLFPEAAVFMDFFLGKYGL